MSHNRLHPCMLLLFTLVPVLVSAEPRALLDDELSQWRTYLGYPNDETQVPDVPRNRDGSYAEPVGYDTDPLKVFTTFQQDGETILQVSGEIYGGIFTREAFSNYRLKLDIKWGEKKWQPRLELPMDTGILYHGTGEHGVDYWRAWPLSQEFQIIEHGVEGNTGDWWKIAHAQIDIRCARDNDQQPYRYHPENPVKTFGGNDGVDITCRASENHEKPHGQWNTLELIVFEDKSLHIVNGKVVMALANSSYPDGDTIKPLTSGSIVLQSEAGEAFYRRITIEPLEQRPAAYSGYF
ncbi:MAG TPA: DUF1080 domain-containing protein [Cellvibrionaceae bacterium]